MFSLALLNALAITERPSDARIRLSNILASLTATDFGLVCTYGSRGTEAVTAVVGAEVGCAVFVEVERSSGDGEGCRVGRQTCERDAVSDRGLLLAGDVHYIKGEELAGDMRKSDVEIDRELLESNMSVTAIEGRNNITSPRLIKKAQRRTSAIAPVLLVCGVV